MNEDKSNDALYSNMKPRVLFVRRGCRTSIGKYDDAMEPRAAEAEAGSVQCQTDVRRKQNSFLFLREIVLNSQTSGG